MNLGSFNGHALNGAVTGEIKSSSELTGEAVINPLGAGRAYGASIVTGEATITPVPATVVRGLAAAVTGRSIVYLTNVRAIRGAEATVSGEAAIGLGAGQVFDLSQAVSGSAVVIPFQGDSAEASGGASVSAEAGIGYGSRAAPFGSVGSITAEPTLHHGGIKNNGLFGVASVIAEAGVADINGDVIYDCVVNLSGSGSIALPDYPIHRPIFAQIDVGSSMTAEMAYKLAIESRLISSSSIVEAQLRVDRYFQAAIIAPFGSVSASASLKTLISTEAAGESECYFTGSLLSELGVTLSGECGIEAAAGIAYRPSANVNGAGVIDPSGIKLSSLSASVSGQCSALASMLSNPRAYAAEIRTYTVPPETRSFAVSEEPRQITVKAA